MSTNTGNGYDVDPQALKKAAGDYRSEGDALIQEPGKVQTGVGSGQVGRHFTEIVGQYHQVFDDFGTVLAGMGNKVIEVGGNLGRTADDYSKTESANTGDLGSV